MTDTSEKETEPGTVEKINLAYADGGHNYYVFDVDDLHRFVDVKKRMDVITLFRNIQQAKVMSNEREQNYVVIPIDPLAESRFKTAMQYKPKTIEEMYPWARDFLFGDTGDEKPKIKRDFPK